GGEGEFDVLARFSLFFELFIESGGGKFGSLQHIDSLRTYGGQQIVQVLGRMHVVRDKVVDLVIGQISLLFTCVDQLFNVVVLVVKSQDGLPFYSSHGKDWKRFLAVGTWSGGPARRAQTFEL